MKSFLHRVWYETDIKRLVLNVRYWGMGAP
jgi:hypothetical protein